MRSIWIALAVLLAAAAPAYADDPVVNYVRVAVDSDTQLNCNDLNIEIANVSRDIGLLESQDEELQGVVAQGAPDNGPQSSNLGNVFAALSNTIGTAAVVDAETSIPAVEASLSNARARVGYLQTLQGSCGNNTAPPQQQQVPQQQAPAVDTSDPPVDAAVTVSICNKSSWKTYISILHASGNGQQYVAQGLWTIPAGVCTAISPSFRRGKIWLWAEGVNSSGTADTRIWSGNDGWFCSGSGLRLYVYGQACDSGQKELSGTLFDLTNHSSWTVTLTPEGIAGSPTGSSPKPSSHKKRRR